MSLAFFLGLGHILGLPASQKLTLDEAVFIGLQNSFAIRTAESNIEKNRQRANEARGALGPKLTLNGTYIRNDQATSTTINGNTVTISPQDSGNAQLSITYPVDIVGVNKLVLDAAKATIASATATRSAEANTVRGNIRQAYFQVLQSESQVKVQEDALASIRETLRITRIKFEAGAVPQFDVVRFEAEEQDAEAAVIAAKNAVVSAKQLLNSMMARPIETPLETVTITELPAKPASADALVHQAIATRSELDATKLRLNALSMVTKSEERGNLPSLSLGATHTRNFKVSGFGGREFSTYGSLNLSFPIFDSGITRARVKAARQDEEQARILLEQQALSISLEVRQTLVRLQNAQDQLMVTQKALEKAAEAFRIARVRYDAGGGIALEVTNAQADLTRAKTAELNARFNYLSAYADLQRAVGSDKLTTIADFSGATKL